MARNRAVVGLMAVVLVAAIPVLVQGQKGQKGGQPTTTTTKIPLKVTVAAQDDFGSDTALRGHPGTGDVEYVDGTRGIDAYITKNGHLWFHIDCRYGDHIDLDFAAGNLIEPGDDGIAPYSEGDMQTFRVATWVPDSETSFGEMQPGLTYANYPVKVQFWTAVDQYAWNLQYDALPDRMSNNSVDVTVSGTATKRTWTITPTQSPMHLFPYAAALFEKYYHYRPDPGGYYHYGTWVMPFKIVLEELK